MKKCRYVGDNPDLLGTTGSIQTWGRSLDETAGKYFPDGSNQGYLVCKDEVILAEPFMPDEDHLKAEPRILEFSNPKGDIVPFDADLTEDEIRELLSDLDTWEKDDQTTFFDELDIEELGDEQS